MVGMCIKTCYLPLACSCQWLVLAKLFPPLNNFDTLDTQTTDRHGSDLLGHLGAFVGMEGKGVLVSLPLLLVVALAA